MCKKSNYFVIPDKKSCDIIEVIEPMDEEDDEPAFIEEISRSDIKKSDRITANMYKFISSMKQRLYSLKLSINHNI